MGSTGGAVEKRQKTAQFERILLFFVGAVVLVLGLKYLKQYVSLMFTLLTLKIVWVLLILLAVLTMMKKKT